MGGNRERSEQPTSASLYRVIRPFLRLGAVYGLVIVFIVVARWTIFLILN